MQQTQRKSLHELSETKNASNATSAVLDYYWLPAGIPCMKNRIDGFTVWGLATLMTLLLVKELDAYWSQQEINNNNNYSCFATQGLSETYVICTCILLFVCSHRFLAFVVYFLFWLHTLSYTMPHMQCVCLNGNHAGCHWTHDTVYAGRQRRCNLLTPGPCILANANNGSSFKAACMTTRRSDCMLWTSNDFMHAVV